MVYPKQFEERAFFDALSISPLVSTRSISELVGCGVRAAEKRLKKLKKASVVRTVSLCLIGK